MVKAANQLPAGSIPADQLGGGDYENPEVEPVEAHEEPKPRGRRGRGRGRSKGPRIADEAEPETVVAGDDAEPSEAERSFMDEQADSDREAAKASHVDDGLKAIAEQVDRLKKGIAYAKAEHDAAVKLAVLTAVADTAAAIADDARRAVRNARAENRNLQPS